MRNNAPKLTKEQHQEVCARYLAGETRNELSVAFTVDVTSVRSILLKNGVAQRPDPRFLLEEVKDEICTLYLADQTADQIASALSINRKSVYKVLKGRGIASRNHKRASTKHPSKLSDAQKQEMCERYQAGETAVTLGPVFGIAKRNVYYWLKKMGVPIRSDATSPSILSKEQFASALTRYQAGEGTSSLAAEFGVQSECLGQLLRRRGSKMRGNRHFVSGSKAPDMLIPEVLAAYRTGESQVSIAKRLGISRGAVLGLLERESIEIRGGAQANSEGRARKYTVNHSFFDDIDTEEKAYWLGFHAADGCVYKTRFQVSLAVKDRVHIEKMAAHMNCNSPIRSDFGCGFEGRYEKCTITINSPKIVQALTQLGLGARKSFNHSWPHHLEDELKRHFLRGYFDGDGTWYRHPNKAEGYFSIISHTEFLLHAQSFLMEKCDLAQTKISPHETSVGIGRIFYGGNRQMEKIAKFLYKDATVFLDRKRAIVEDLLVSQSRKSSSYVLSEEDRCEILKRVAAGEVQAVVAREFGITSGAITYLKNSGR